MGPTLSGQPFRFQPWGFSGAIRGKSEFLELLKWHSKALKAIRGMSLGSGMP